MYAVVHFVEDESVECVPKSWLEGVCIHNLPNEIDINAYLYPQKTMSFLQVNIL